MRTFSRLVLPIILLVFGNFTNAIPADASEGMQVGTEGAGEGLTAKEMINYHIDATRGMTSHGTMEMEIVTSDWDRTIEMEWWEKGEDRFLITVLAPARDLGNGTLKIDNNLWNYVYAFDETIHIPAALMMQSWMGSDFTNDDIVRDSSLTDNYEHVLEEIEEVNGERCYIIYMSTEPSTPVPWLTMRIWLRTEDLLPVRQEYYDDDGVLARYMEFCDFKYMYDRTIPATMRMISTDNADEYTELMYTDVQFNIELDDDIFTLTRLENPDV